MALILYTLAAVGGLSVVACAAVLIACVRIARAADADEIRRVSALVPDDGNDTNYDLFI